MWQKKIHFYSLPNWFISAQRQGFGAGTFALVRTIVWRSFRAALILNLTHSSCNARKYRSRRNQKRLLHGNYNSIIKKLNSYELRMELSVDSSFASRPWKVSAPNEFASNFNFNTHRCWESFAFWKIIFIAKTTLVPAMLRIWGGGEWDFLQILWKVGAIRGP